VRAYAAAILSDPSALILVILPVDSCQATLPKSAQLSKVRSKLADIYLSCRREKRACISGPRGLPSKFPELGTVCTVDKPRQNFQPNRNLSQALDLFTWSRINVT
jgi:hypothetical protein